MQPNRDPSEWRQPSEQPSQAPYTPAPEETRTPIVTLSPDESTVVSTEAFELATTEEKRESDESDASAVRWQATEYIHREKTPLWFIIFAIVGILLIAGAIFVVKSITFAILVPVMATALLVYSHRPPRVLNYTLSRHGLHVDDRLYSFIEFKGFAVIHGDDEYSVMLIPTKRFRPGVSVYFPEEAGEAIVDMLGARLPMQELHLDVVDQIVRKLRL